MVSQARTLASMCDEQGLSSDRILIQLPATYAGIQAASTLQKSSIDCEINGVYSLPQAAFAVNGGVAVMVINVCHINLWYDRNPGAIRDPHVRSLAHVQVPAFQITLLKGFLVAHNADGFLLGVGNWHQNSRAMG